MSLTVKLILSLLLFAFVGCQQGKVTLDETLKAEISETIQQLTKEAFEAGSSNDLDKMFSYFSDNTITIEHGKIDHSWAEHMKTAREMMANIEAGEWIIDEMAVDVLSTDVAVLYGIYHYSMRDKSDNTIEGNNAWTWVFNREEDNWKIRHIHISAVQ